MTPAGATKVSFPNPRPPGVNPQRPACVIQYNKTVKKRREAGKRLTRGPAENKVEHEACGQARAGR